MIESKRFDTLEYLDAVKNVYPLHTGFVRPLSSLEPRLVDGQDLWDVESEESSNVCKIISVSSFRLVVAGEDGGYFL